MLGMGTSFILPLWTAITTAAFIGKSSAVGRSYTFALRLRKKNVAKKQNTLLFASFWAPKMECRCSRKCFHFLVCFPFLSRNPRVLSLLRPKTVVSKNRRYSYSFQLQYAPALVDQMEQVLSIHDSTIPILDNSIRSSKNQSHSCRE